MVAIKHLALGRRTSPRRASLLLLMVLKMMMAPTVAIGDGIRFVSAASAMEAAGGRGRHLARAIRVMEALLLLLHLQLVMRKRLRLGTQVLLRVLLRVRTRAAAEATFPHMVSIVHRRPSVTVVGLLLLLHLILARRPRPAALHIVERGRAGGDGPPSP